MAQPTLIQTGSYGNVPFAYQSDCGDTYTLSGTRGPPEGVELPVVTTRLLRTVQGGSANELH